MHSKRLQTITVMLAITALCTMILAFLVYHITAESLKKEITNAYHVSLLHTRDRMETYLRQLDQVTLQFEKIPEVQTFILQNDDAGLERIDAMTMVSLMQRIHASLEHVDNVVVYDVRSRVLYATNSVMNPIYANYLPVISDFSGRNVKRAFLNMEVEGIPTTIYIKKMPAFNQIQPVYIFFHINQRIYDDFLGEGRYSDAGNYFIVDAEGELMASRGSVEDEEIISSWVAQINQDKASVPEVGVGSFTLNDSFVTFLPLSYDGWVYGFAIPNDVFLHQLNTLRNVILTISISLFAASIVLSVLSSHWLWRGWNRIKTVLDDPAVQVPAKLSNEFDMMYSKIRTVVEQSKLLRNQMDELMPTMQETVMMTLLEGGLRTEDDWAKVRRYGIHLQDGGYGCFCVEMDQDWEDSPYSERDRLIFEYAVISVIREVIGQSGFAVRTDKGSFAAVISDGKQENEELSKEILQMADHIHRFIGRHFPMSVSIGVSRVRHNLSHLNLAYREARELLYNKLIAGGNRLFTCDAAAEVSTGDPFPIREVENDILYGIRTRDRDYAYESVERLLEVRSNPNVQYKWLQSKLVETAQSIFRNVGKSLQHTDHLEEPTVTELLQLSTLDDWIAWFRCQCIDPLIARLSDQYDQQAERAVQLITAYIRDHLESDLKLEACSRAIQIPVSFAKQSLKEKLGITFNELVYKERIYQAQQWLVGSAMSIEEMARKLQYSNAQNFSRTFKKAVGIPPGQYRIQGGTLHRPAAVVHEHNQP